MLKFTKYYWKLPVKFHPHPPQNNQHASGIEQDYSVKERDLLKSYIVDSPRRLICLIYRKWVKGSNFMHGLP